VAHGECGSRGFVLYVIFVWRALCIFMKFCRVSQIKKKKTLIAVGGSTGHDDWAETCYACTSAHKVRFGLVQSYILKYPEPNTLNQIPARSDYCNSSKYTAPLRRSTLATTYTLVLNTVLDKSWSLHILQSLVVSL
jgi:hypothetical protein